MIGNISTKLRNETSYNNYDISVLKSAIQKYCRRNELKKGIWCLIELDLFSLVESSSDKNISMAAKRIRTNMINRMIVMMSEEISISTWWLPIKIYQLYENWTQNRNNDIGKSYLLKIYHYLCNSSKIRIISDYRSLYLLPTYYVDEKYLSILDKMKDDICMKYPNIYKKTNEMEIIKYLKEKYDIKNFVNNFDKNIITLLENCDERIFYIFNKIIYKNHKLIKKLWMILYNFYTDTMRKNVIECLNNFYNKMTHKEKPIYLYHAILLIIRRNDINWNTQPYDLLYYDKDKVSKLYDYNLKYNIIELEDYIYDVHTKYGGTDGLMKFVNEGSLVVNEDKGLYNEEYRNIYIELKNIINITNFSSKSEHILEIDVKKLDTNLKNKIINAPHGQKLTSKNKKIVYILDNIVVKGPYKIKDTKFNNSIKFTIAFQILENELGLEDKYKTCLPWLYILKDKDNYYLVSKNIGDMSKMSYEYVDSKIEKNVPVIKRGGFVHRISEIEENISNEIKIACLQHLYIRYLLGVGDSGTHNILLRKDESDNLVVGNDMEEIRMNKNPKNKLQCLFRIVYAKHKIIYSQYIEKIKVFDDDYDFSDEIQKRFEAIGIEISEIRDNITRWNKF